MDVSAARAKAFVQVLSCVLSRLVAANDAVSENTGVVTKFHALRPPSISIRDYLERINKYASCSPECFVLALVYIDRLIQRNALLLTSLNCHRVIITALMLAAKFFDDQYFNNAYYAKVGGVPCAEINSLELEFLFSINFSLHVTGDVFERYYSELANHTTTSLAQAQQTASGLPPDPHMGAPCDCARFTGSMRYVDDEIRETGLRLGSRGGLVAQSGSGSGSGAAMEDAAPAAAPATAPAPAPSVTAGMEDAAPARSSGW